ncbi:MAG: SDR family NAD(P)-dependent oxidoreductase [Hyphomicrobiaceae bacterium]
MPVYDSGPSSAQDNGAVALTASKSLQHGNFAGRIILVTGASRGLGRASALALAEAGAHVIALARRRSRLEDLDDAIRVRGGPPPTLIQMDLTNGEQVDGLGPALYQRFGRLDGLVANAAILGTLSPLNHVTADDWGKVLDTNLTANWRLVRTLDPLLRASDAGRAVFVSSGAALTQSAYWGPYAVSKAGLEALAQTYANEVSSSAVRVSILDPGPLRTDMRAKAFPGENPTKNPDPAEVAPLVLQLLSPDWLENGARVRHPRAA